MQTFRGVWELIDKDVQAGTDPVVAGFTKLLRGGVFSVARSSTYGVRAGFIALMRKHKIEVRFSTSWINALGIREL